MVGLSGRLVIQATTTGTAARAAAFARQDFFVRLDTLTIKVFGIFRTSNVRKKFAICSKNMYNLVIKTKRRWLI